MTAPQRLGSRLGITEGQVYTLAIGLALGLVLLSMSVPNLREAVSAPPLATLDTIPTQVDGSPAPTAVAGDDVVAGPASPPTTALTPGRAPVVPAAPGPAAGGTDVPDPAPGPTLSASDRGVTPTSIHLSFLVEAGDGGRPTVEASAAAVDFWVAHLNAAGGVLGRTVTAAVLPIDAADRSSAEAACEAATVTRPSFLVVALGRADAACVVDEHETLLLATHGAASALHGAGQGRLFTWGMAADRLLRTQVARLDEQGLLDGTTIGVVYAGAEPYRAAVEDGLIGELERRGRDVSVFVELAGDESATDLAVASVTMAASGVDLVFQVADAAQIRAWVVEADRLQWTPRYALSDIGDGVAHDFSDYPASFEAVGHSTTIGRHDRNAGVGNGRVPAVYEQCRTRYRDATGIDLVAPGPSSPVDVVAAWDALMAPCRDLLLFVEAATAAGTELTRVGFAQVLRGLGSLDHWTNPAGSTFGGSTEDAPNQARAVHWERPCPRDPSGLPGGCWTVAGPFAQAENRT